MVLMVLPSDASLRVTTCFLGPLALGSGRFFRRKILSVGTLISMKASVCGDDFSPQVIRWSILTTSENVVDGVVHVNAITENRETYRILRENS